MSSQPKLAGIAVGDHVTIMNAYGREVRGRVVTVHADGSCSLLGDNPRHVLRAGEWNTLRVERIVSDPP